MSTGRSSVATIWQYITSSMFEMDTASTLFFLAGGQELEMTALLPLLRLVSISDWRVEGMKPCLLCDVAPSKMLVIALSSYILATCSAFS